MAIFDAVKLDKGATKELLALHDVKGWIYKGSLTNLYLKSAKKLNLDPHTDAYQNAFEVHLRKLKSSYETKWVPRQKIGG